MQPSARSNPATPEVLWRRLLDAGIRPAIERRGKLLTTTGASECLSIDDLLANPDLLPDRLSEVREAVALGLPAILTIEGTTESGLARAEIEALFAALVAQFDGPAIESGRIGVATSVATFSSYAYGHLEHIDAVAAEMLCGGPRFVLLDPDAGTDSDEADGLFRVLHARQSRSSRPNPAVATVVASQCPLLSGELASRIAPGAGMASPHGAAWLPLEVDLSRFADAGGCIDDDALAKALDTCIDAGDTLFDELHWPQDAQRCDAYLNRRVVTVLTGLGDLVARRGEDPTDIGCLRALDCRVRDIHEHLRRRSHQLAAARGALPALADREPSADWKDDDHWQMWRQRWRRAFEETRVRHRNLLVMSPYAVLPRTERPPPSYADLLPVIAHADALAFAGAPPVSHWKFNEFKGFHQRVLALVERQNAASFVATGV